MLKEVERLPIAPFIRTLTNVEAAASPARGVLHALPRHRIGLVGLVLTLFMFTLALLAPVLAPHDPLAMVPAARFAAPSLAYPFGADEFGRDLFSRLLFAGRTAFLVGATSVAIATIIGVGAGLITGYLSATIIDLARRQGAERAAQIGDDSLLAFSNSADDWRKGDALQIEVLEQTEDRYSFDVTRCRYAEMYRTLGLAELGAVLSCNRDFSLVEGFNPEIRLTRDQTIMQGAACCTFRYARGSAEDPPAATAS